MTQRKSFARRKTDVSTIVFLVLAILGQLIIPNDECVACTVGVASGHVTMDGRPLAWKARAPNIRPAIIAHVDACPYGHDRRYDYLAIHNYDEAEELAPMGLSESGVAGGNATAGAGGYHSQHYLLENFDDFSEIRTYYEDLVYGDLCAYFPEWCGSYYWEQSNFTHIDANGNASIFEVNSINWVYEYDAMDPDREAQGLLGFVVRANEFHARPDGTDDVNITGGRYESGTYNVKGLVDINMLCARTLVQGNDGANGYEFARYGPGRELATIATPGTVGFMVAQGVLADEDPALSTMWTILGPLNYGIAVPAWVKVSDIPECLSNGSMWSRAKSLYDKGNETITQASVFPAEAHLFDMVDNRLLPRWRAMGVPSEAEMTRIEHQMAKDAYSLLNCLDKHQYDNKAPEVAFDGIQHASGITLTFTATTEDSDGTIANIEWNFGDDQNSVGDSVSHTYSKAGTYLVSCTVTDDDGVSITDWKYFDVVDYDLVDDNVINILDLAEFVGHWLDTNCGEPNWCCGTDFNHDEIVNFYDFALLSQYWLQAIGLLNPRFVFAPNSPELSFARDSIAYDYNLAEYAPDTRRIETVCLASRPEVTINMDVSTHVLDVDDNYVICGGISQFLFTTTDGETFTAILDIRSDTPLDSGGCFSDYTVPDEIIEGLRVMADGSWLLSTGRLQVDIRGHLFRSVNKGASWSVCKFAADGSDFQFGMGYVPPWHSTGIAGPEVVIGEYGNLHQPNNPRRIYYSDDYGATWTMIIDIGPAGWEPSWPGQKGQHCHAVCFGIQDTNAVFASWGDTDFMRISKFVCSGDKKDPNNWQDVELPWKLFTYETNPVCLFNDGSHIYVGRDAGIAPTLWRFDANETRETVISSPTPLVDSNGLPFAFEGAPYRGPDGDGTYVFGMYKYEGVYYAAVSAHGWLRAGSGIYVSTDGKHWVCARHDFGVRGFYTIAGYANGYIWGTYKDVDNINRLYKFTPVDAKQVSALRVERGITNIANSADDSYFDTAVEGWSTYYDINSIEWTDTEHLLGNGCLRVTGLKEGATKGFVLTEHFRDMGGLPNPGDYICMSAWVKAADHWPVKASFFVNFENNTNLIYGVSQVQLTTEWQRVTLWAKCDGTPSSSLRGKFNLYPGGYTGDYSDFEWYIDGFQVVYFPDLHYSGDWQKGGVPRADELAICPLTGLSNSFTLSFTWLPDGGSHEWHDDCPIATIVALDGSYLELFWDYSAREFAITDGTNTEIIDSGGESEWDFYDMVKFAIVSDGSETNLYIESSINGLASVIGSNGCVLTSAPSHLALSSDNDQTRLGSGLFSTVKVWDWEFTPIDVNEIFDIID